MSRNNVRVLAFGGLHVTLCCTYWRVAGSLLQLSLRRPTGALLVLLSASSDEIFTWCATPSGCLHGCLVVVTRMQAGNMVEYSTTEAREDLRQ